MKNKFLSILFLLIVFQFFSNKINAGSNLFYITIGKGNDCKGYNICSIDIANENVQDNSQVKVIISLKENKIQFAFLKNSVSPQLFLNYFSTGFFLLDQDYILPQSVVNNINIKNKILKMGKYKITTNATAYIVEF